MPSFEMKQKLIQKSPTGNPRANVTLKHMERTWDRDISSKKCYVFDYYHEFDPFVLNDINIEDIPNLVEVECKYIINQSQTYSKDPVGYHIMFKPSFDLDNITEYYKEYFIDRYNAESPCGLYILIPDVKGRYNRWLVVAGANNNDTLFPTYEILRCDTTVNYVLDNKTWDVAAVRRSQNS